MDADTAQPENPVRDIRITLATAQRNPGNKEMPFAITPQMECRLINAQQPQPRLGVGDRPPGQDGLDTREGQRWASGGIVHLHVKQSQIRIDPLPAGLDATDADRLPQALAHESLDVRPVLFDVWQDAVAQCQHQRDEAEIDEPEAPDHQPPQSPRDGRSGQPGEPRKAPTGSRAYGVRAHHRGSAGRRFCQLSESVTRMSK